jgi:hypothetical protein
MSSANNTVSDIEFLLRRRSHMYVMHNRDPTIYPSGTPCFSVHQTEETFLVVLGDFTSTFCLLLLKQKQPSYRPTPPIP